MEPKLRKIPSDEEITRIIIDNKTTEPKTIKQIFAEIDEKRLPVAWTYDQKFSAVMVEIERRMDEIDKKLDRLCAALLIKLPPIEVEYEKKEDPSI